MTGKEYLEIKKNTTGIYWFRNTENNKYYVGQALDIRKRFNKHMSRMRRKFNYPLYNALNKYGLDKFEYSIELILDTENKSNEDIQKELNELEIKYIKKYNSFENGYNLTIGGESISGYHQTEETKQRLSNATKEIQNDGRNKVYVYNILTKEYSEWNTLKEFLNKYDLKTKYIASKKLVVVDNQWIAARTKDELEEKIKNVPNENSQARNSGRIVYKNDLSNSELNQDIQNLSIKDFCNKYNVTKGTYYNYLKKLGISNKTVLGKDPRTKCNKENFLKDYPNLSRKEFCDKYQISDRTYYDMKKRYLI